MTDVDKRADDQDARDQAIDVVRSFIVRAPAGSGKTTLLIQRYLALLATVDEPEEIVAITFTRKAAAEMRERVLMALAESRNADSKLDATTRRLAHAALARDTQCQWQLASNASRLRIQTIDSLNASITRQMPWTSRFGAQPEIIEDANALYLEAARAVLAEVNAGSALAADVSALLVHLDNNLLIAERLLAEMLRARDHWLRNLPRMDEREILESALARARETAVAAVARRFPEDEKVQTLALARFAGENMPENLADAGVCPQDVMAQWPGSSESSLPAWLVLADLFLTQKGAWRKRGGLNKNVGFPPEFREQKSRMGDLLDRLERTSQAAQLANALNGLRTLPPAHYTTQQWEVLGAIVRLLPQATAMLWTVFSRHGQCDFTEIALSASRALGNDDAPTDLALALDYRISHLLVDEFQDTSVEQFALLEKLTRGWDAGDGRTLFLVGDPMQSIYRFRKAEVGLFSQATGDGIGTVELSTLQLTVNFRSDAGVVDWVNKTFAYLMPVEAETDEGQVPYTDSVAAAANIESQHAVVIWHPQVSRKVETDADIPNDAAADVELEEAHRVVGIIDSTPAGQSIALLVRNRTHLAAIVPALKNAGIAFRAIDIDPLGERPVVQDLLTLTRALMHPADRIAWLAALRAPWCGLTLNDLALLAGGVPTEDGALSLDVRTTWAIVNDESRLALLSTDGQARISSLRDVIGPAISGYRREPLRELVERVWLALRGPACLADAGELDDAAQLLELLEMEAAAQTGGSHIVDLVQLDARVAKLFAGNRAPASSERPAVQIMTIHRAKGLEFDTVIVPSLHRIPRRDDKKLLIWADRWIPVRNQRELILAPIREAGADDETDAIYRYVQQLEQSKQRAEDVRLLYVAATRAKRCLHLLGAATQKVDKAVDRLAAPRAGSLLASLWPAVEPVFTDVLVKQDRARSTQHERISSDAGNRLTAGAVRLVSSQKLPLMPAEVVGGFGKSRVAPATAVDFDWAGEIARHVGTVVHAWLQRIAEDGVARWDGERISSSARVIETELAQFGVAADGISAAALRVVDALTNTVADPRGRWALQSHQEARAEWRLTGMQDGALVNIAIDRTFVDEQNVRWIIDFKTGNHEGADIDAFLDNERRRYSAQLETYAGILTAMPSLRQQTAVKLGLYFPMLKGWREWQWS